MSGITKVAGASDKRSVVAALDTHHANRHAAIHATADRTSPSARRLRTIRHRDAPSDCRNASSRCPTAALAISRLATFAHTMTMVKSVTIEKTASILSPRIATRLSPPAVAEDATSLGFNA